jgi:uncharacterized protein (TIGR02757 family)
MKSDNQVNSNKVRKVSSSTDLYSFLEEKYDQYNRHSFIETDPISIPHLFDKQEDIEIAGFLAATIAWGQRTTIIKNAKKLMLLMDNAPFDFVMNHSKNDLNRLNNFKHRTFNQIDCVFFIQSLQNIYANYNGMEKLFAGGLTDNNNMQNAINYFKTVFFEIEHSTRTQKHISDPMKKSAAKRINMFLRWMVRKDKRGVDFGIWKNISPADLHMPLDVHSGTVARKLGLLQRAQNDWQAVVELTEVLKQFDPKDPVKYDFALFGLGAFEKF